LEQHQRADQQQRAERRLGAHNVKPQRPDAIGAQHVGALDRAWIGPEQDEMRSGDDERECDEQDELRMLGTIDEGVDDSPLQGIADRKQQQRRKRGERPWRQLRCQP
jgi:hypothetical protein